MNFIKILGYLYTRGGNQVFLAIFGLMLPYFVKLSVQVNYTCNSLTILFNTNYICEPF